MSIIWESFKPDSTYFPIYITGGSEEHCGLTNLISIKIQMLKKSQFRSKNLNFDEFNIKLKF